MMIMMVVVVVMRMMMMILMAMVHSYLSRYNKDNNNEGKDSGGKKCNHRDR